MLESVNISSDVSFNYLFSSPFGKPLDPVEINSVYEILGKSDELDVILWFYRLSI